MTARYISFALLSSLLGSVTGLTLSGTVNTREPEAFMISIVNPGPETVNVTAYYNLFDGYFADSNNPLIFKNQTGSNYIAQPYINYPSAPTNCSAKAPVYLTLRPGDPFHREVVLSQFINKQYLRSPAQTAVSVSLPSFATGFVIQDGQTVGPEQAFAIDAQPYQTKISV